MHEDQHTASVRYEAVALRLGTKYLEEEASASLRYEDHHHDDDDDDDHDDDDDDDASVYSHCHLGGNIT